MQVKQMLKKPLQTSAVVVEACRGLVSEENLVENFCGKPLTLTCLARLLFAVA